jgi:NAD(P)H-hydrate epimerase
MRSLTRAEVREIDRLVIEEFGIPGIVLMENAGGGVARLLDSLGVDGPVAIACGRGNNGGDGFVIARHLEALGHEVRILLAAEPPARAGDAAANLHTAERAGLAIACLAAAGSAEWRRHLDGAAWIVDALLGTGSSGPPRAAAAVAIEALEYVRDAARSAGRPVKTLAVDLPSGLDADTGDAPGWCVRADVTATFVAPKRGFDNAAARDFIGEVHVLGIGAPVSLLERFGVSPAVRGRGTCS